MEVAEGPEGRRRSRSSVSQSPQHQRAPSPSPRRPSVLKLSPSLAGGPGSLGSPGGSSSSPRTASAAPREIPQPTQQAVIVNTVNGANNLLMDGRKIKSAANALIQNSMWRTPLQTHNLRNGTVAFVTIRVRVMLGDAEQDINIKFDQANVLVEAICQAVALKQGLSNVAARLFSLWIIGKDLGGCGCVWLHPSAPSPTALLIAPIYPTQSCSSDPTLRCLNS